LQLVNQYVPLQGQRVLDVGCGMGLYTAAFCQFTPHAYGVEIEPERAAQAKTCASIAIAPGERLPFADNIFDVVFSHEVIEHVTNDAWTIREMVRVARPGGRIVIFCPNRWWPFETHGHFWRGQYHFGNTPLINYLPDVWRNQLAPHVRVYTGHTLRLLFAHLPVRLIVHRRIFPGFDKVAVRRPVLARFVRTVTYTLENTPLQIFGLSHFLVVEKK
jgi:SAM-dependent methyltransferase